MREDSSGVLSEAPVFEDQPDQFGSPFEMEGTNSPPPVDPKMLRAVNSVVMGRPFLNQMKEIMRELRAEENHSIHSDEEPDHPEGPRKQPTPQGGGDISSITLQQLMEMFKEKKIDSDSTGPESEEDILPPNYIMPQFPLYNGTSNPSIHVNNYEDIMRMKGLSDRQLAKLFLVTLTGDAGEWMNGQPHSLRTNWKELSKLFMERYAHTTKS